MDKLIAAVGRRINPSGVKELTIRQYGAEQIEVIIPEIEEREVEQIKQQDQHQRFARVPHRRQCERRPRADQGGHQDARPRRLHRRPSLEGRWVKAGPELDMPERHGARSQGRGREILVRIDPYRRRRRLSDRAWPDFAEGRLAVSFRFDAKGGAKVRPADQHNLPDTTIGFHRQLGIILDNMMLSAPRINSTIRERGVITGRSPKQEVNFLVGVLNAGSLPATLASRADQPAADQLAVGRRHDSQGHRCRSSSRPRRSWSSCSSTTASAGIVADIAVVLNMIVTVALMILIKAAFTLPGLAGLVLTVGMAVDANVLIYERMREETERGASLRMAIRNGFRRAMATIIDSHVTTLVSAVVLYVVGTDQIKGFAVTLIIGLVDELVHGRLRGPRDVRHRREAALADAAEHDARHRPHEHRLHPLARPGHRRLGDL